MEPLIIALICAASLGGLLTLSAFVRQLLLSRDKQINDAAQQRAMSQEAEQLERMRLQIKEERFAAYKNVMGENRDAIIYLDNKIAEIFHKKEELIQRYGDLAQKEAGAIIDGLRSIERMEMVRRLKAELEKQIKFYEEELVRIQEQRAGLWEHRNEFQGYLLNQEKKRNQMLDVIYQQHTAVLEKVYLRHTENTEQVAKFNIDASTDTYKNILLLPLKYLAKVFSLSSFMSGDQVKLEKLKRTAVSQVEADVNKNDPDMEGVMLKNREQLDQAHHLGS